jgi:hypothetical protein
MLEITDSETIDDKTIAMAGATIQLDAAPLLGAGLVIDSTSSSLIDDGEITSDATIDSQQGRRRSIHKAGARCRVVRAIAGCCEIAATCHAPMGAGGDVRR